MVQLESSMRGEELGHSHGHWEPAAAVPASCNWSAWARCGRLAHHCGIDGLKQPSGGRTRLTEDQLLGASEINGYRTAF